jgi:hypothetical protein
MYGFKQASVSCLVVVKKIGMFKGSPMYALSSGGEEDRNV